MSHILRLRRSLRFQKTRCGVRFVGSAPPRSINLRQRYCRNPWLVSLPTFGSLCASHKCPLGTRFPTSPFTQGRLLPYPLLVSHSDYGLPATVPHLHKPSALPPSGRALQTVQKASEVSEGRSPLIVNPKPAACSAAQNRLHRFWASALRSPSGCPHASVRSAHPSGGFGTLA